MILNNKKMYFKEKKFGTLGFTQINPWKRTDCIIQI